MQAKDRLTLLGFPTAKTLRLTAVEESFPDAVAQTRKMRFVFL